MEALWGSLKSWFIGGLMSAVLAGLLHLLVRLWRKPKSTVMADGGGLKEDEMDLNKELVPAIVSIHLGLKEGKAQILVEADLAALAQKEADGSSNAVVKAVLGVIAQGIKLVP